MNFVDHFVHVLILSLRMGYSQQRDDGIKRIKAFKRGLNIK